LKFLAPIFLAAAITSGAPSPALSNDLAGEGAGAPQKQALDTEYTRIIKDSTTGPQFITELVDHLPASATVPTPLKFNGYIAGAEGHLTYAEDVYRYMRALAAATPRVKVFSIGKSEEGREMVLVAVSSEQNLAKLDRYKEITRKLSDPRGTGDDEARKLIAEGVPMYYATGAMHSPETGSPEMLMELAYRLAVDDSPFIKSIRDNVIVLMTPVLEVDGRDRMVDLWNYRKNNPKVPTPPLVYWGHYVAHDNNRDNIGLALNLSRNVMAAYFDFHPQVIHDLHESVPFLYVSTGTGPYNASLDPVMIDEWHRMAYHELDEMTRRGVPGVWTHGFYDGWAPNYMFWIGMGHNTIGRFYETFGNRWPTTENRVVRGASDREWFRPNPPLPTVRWSLRNNTNYQESMLLFGLSDMAEHRQHFLEQFYLLGKRAAAKAANEGPAAWVFDGAQKHQGQLHDLMALLRTHGVEVSVADEPFGGAPAPSPAGAAENRAGGGAGAPRDSFAKGAFVIRMDQPYSRLADAMLDTQYVRADEKVYDDTGWTLGYLKNLDFKRVVSPDALKVKMHAWDGSPAGAAPAENNADTDYAKSWFKSHPAPRIALIHTWLRTQDEGWWRLAFESLGIPYTYLSTQKIAAMPALREKFDVIVFPPVGGADPSEIVEGYPAGAPLPWRKTSLTPNLGVDETDDMRPGLGLDGVRNMARFVEDGGLLITARDTSVFAVTYGLTRYVQVARTTKLRAPGTIVQTTVVDRKSPVASGYDESLPMYFANNPVFTVGLGNRPEDESRPSGRGGKNDPDVPQGRPYVPLPEKPKAAPGEEGFQPPEDMPQNADHLMPRPEDRPRVIVAFAKAADKLLLSGMLDGGEDLAGKPAVILAPRGKGNVLLFATNPMWRNNTQGTYALVTNALMSWDHLR
jgi:zinc carboxypeptidase